MAAPRSPVAMPSSGSRCAAVELGDGEPAQPGGGADEVGHEVVGRVAEQLGRRAELGQPAALGHHRDLVAHLHGLVDVVGDQDDGLAEVALQPQELVLEPCPDDRVDGRERLVHQQHRRVGGQRAGDADALLLAAGELVRDSGRRTSSGSSPTRSSSSSARCPGLRLRACRSATARWRRWWRSSGGGTARSAGSRSRSGAAAGRDPRR